MGSHTPGTSESVNQPEPLAFACKLAVRPAFVNALLLSGEPPTVYLAFRLIFHNQLFQCSQIRTLGVAVFALASTVR